MAKQQLLLLTLVCLLSYTIAQYPPISNGPFAIKPCEQYIFQWNVQPTFDRFTLALTITSLTDAPGGSLNLVFTSNPPLSIDRNCETNCSIAATNGNSCQLQEGCAVPRGMWYAIVTSTGVQDIEFTFDTQITAFTAPIQLNIGSDKDAPLDLRGTITREANLTDPVDKYDYFYFDVNPTSSDVEGTMVVVEISLRGVDPVPTRLPFSAYLNYGPNATYVPLQGCSFLSGVDQLEVPPCYFKQGGRWYLSVLREALEDGNTTYTLEVKVYKQAPRIVDITANTKVYDRLLKLDDVVYFRFKGLIGQDVSKTVMFAVIDNVVGGQVEMQTNYQNLPFGDCTNPKDCLADTGCHTRYSPCELAGNTQHNWYIGVRVRYLYDTTKPVTFTVSFDLEQIRPKALPVNAKTTGISRHGQYQHYTLSREAFKTSNDWLEIYVYLDASLQTFLGDTQGFVYINDRPYAGSDSCFSYLDYCTLQVFSKDIKVCSIQLDPCELARYNDALYISVFMEDTSEYYWYQTNIQYTIETKIYNPATKPYSLYDGNVRTGVVAEGEYSVFRVPGPITGTIKVTASSVNEQSNSLPSDIVNDQCAEILVANNGSTCINNIYGLSCCVCGSKCQSSDVTCNQNPNQGCGFKKRQAGETQITMHIFYGESLQAPSCNCWTPHATYQLSAGDKETHEDVVTGCTVALSPKDGFYVIIEGNVNSFIANEYRYRQNEFALSVEIEQFDADYFAIPLLKGVLQYGKLLQTTVTRYVLSFDRNDLLNHALVIVTQAHKQSGAFTNVVKFPNNGEKLACSEGSSISKCQVDSTTNSVSNDGWCAQTFQPCQIWNGNEDNSHIIVEVSTPRNVDETDQQFSISYNLIPQTPIKLGFGVPQSIPAGAHKDLYSHFVVDVPQSAINTKSLVVTAYYDAGHIYKDTEPANPNPISFFVNTPSNPRKAGQPFDCLCHEQAFNQTRKVVYVVDTCKLQPGRYHFSIKTTQNIFGSFPQYYTVKAELLDAVVNGQFNKPVDYSVYVGQSVSFKINIPNSMITSTTDVEKVLRPRLTATNEFDQLTLKMSKANPALCYCDLVSLTSCSTSLAGAGGVERQDCQVNVDYCGLNSGEWYVTVSTGLNVKDPLNPVPFTIFLDKTNLQNVSQLRLTQGCDDSARAANTIDDKVLHLQYHHYQINGASGEDVATLHINNITDGYVTVYFNQHNLATSGCNLNPAGITCPEGSDCVFPTICGEKLDFISLYGVSTNKNNPVRYNISVCATPTATIGLNSPRNAETIENVGGNRVYKTSLGGLSETSALAIILRNTQNANGVTVQISQALCSGCQTGFSRQFTCDGDCAFPLLPCDLPLNYKSLDYIVNVISATEQLQYDIELKTIAPPQPVPIQTTLTSADPTEFSVPALSYAIYSWTIGQNEIKSFEQGIQRARFQLIAKDSVGAAVQSAFITAQADASCPKTTNTHVQDTAVVYGVATCCVQAGTYYVSLFNRAPSDAATFTIQAIIDQESAHQVVEWRSPSTSAVVTVPAYDPDTHVAPVYQEAHIFYPGLDAFDSSLLVSVEAHTDDDFGQTAYYVSTSNVAGDNTRSPCFGYSSRQDPYSAPQTVQRYTCNTNPIIPDDYWFGFVNRGSNERQFNFTVENYPAVDLAFGTKKNHQITNRLARETSVITQFKVPINAVNDPTRSVFFEVEAISDDLTVYIQKNGPAGENTQTCLGHFDTQTISSGSTVKFQYSSCDFDDTTYYIGIKPNTKTGDVLEYNVHTYLNVTFDSIQFTNLPIGTELTGQTLNPDTNDLRYELTTSTVQNFTYLQVKFTDLNPDASFTWNVEGNCETLDTMHCNTNPNDETCSTIVFPCQIQSNAKYHFRMENYVGTGYTVTATQFNPTVTDIAVGAFQTGSVNVHELQIYRVKLTNEVFSPGQQVQITLTDLSCGTVEVWINKNAPAGSTDDCNINAQHVPCTSVGCNLISFESCQTMYEDINAEYYITVRGLSRFNTDPNTPITYTLNVFTADTATVKEMHTNEEVIVYAYPTNVTGSTCPSDNRLLYPQECCPVPPATVNRPYIVENVYWGVPVEGAHYLENYPIIELQLSGRYSEATVSVRTEAPQFCGDQPQPPVWTGTCKSSHTCRIHLPSCILRDHRQFFVWIDPASVTPPIVYGNTEKQIEVARIRYRKHFYTVVDINFSDKSQYLKYTLRDNETQYFRINHNQINRRDYWFNAKVIQSFGGRIELFDNWDNCFTTPCVEPQICNSVNDGLCTATLPECVCSNNKVRCSDKVDRNGYSYLKLTPHLEAGVSFEDQRVLTGRLQFDFIVPIIPIPPNCDQVHGLDYKFYDPKLTPTNEQIWTFRVRALGGLTTRLYVGEHSIPTSLSCSYSDMCTSVNDVGCQSTQTTVGSYIHYRKESNAPILSVNGATAGQTTNYLLEAKLLTVPVQQLENGVNFTSPKTFISNGCIATNVTEYYKYTPAAGDDTMLVELFSSGATVYMFPGHVTYKYSRPGQQCTTNGGYCSFLVACNLEKTTYYFHVPQGAHSIRVSSFKHTVTTLNLGQTVNFVINSPGQLVIYELKIPGGTSQDPTKDLDIQVNNPSVQFWVNRNIWGDNSCAVALDNTNAIPRVLECAVRKDSETYYFSFLGKSGTCTPQPIFLHVTLNADALQPGIIDLGNNPPANIKVPVGQTVRVASSFPALLTKDEVVYVRLPTVLYGDVDHKVIKGNHLAPTRDRALPCAEGSCTAVQRKHVSWHDYCFHCGIYQDFFVEITGQSVKLQSDAPVVTASIQKKLWQPLNTNWITSTLAGPTSSMDFYTASIKEGASHMLDIYVTSGVGVEVEIYPVNCSLRYDSVKMWCFNEQDCQIPLPTRGNVGYFYEGTSTDSLWTDTAFRVVIYGRDTTYKIRHFNGAEICVNGFSKALTPFCASVKSQEGRASWGTLTTWNYKDTYANTFYNELYTAFSCLQKSGCFCKPLSQPCIDNLKAYACETAFPECATSSHVTPPTYRRCYDIEQTCQATFEDAGLPHLGCYHNFYPGGVLFTKSASDPGVPSSAESIKYTHFIMVIVGILGAMMML